jgi:hypothetical protein
VCFGLVSGGVALGGEMSVAAQLAVVSGSMRVVSGGGGVRVEVPVRRSSTSEDGSLGEKEMDRRTDVLSAPGVSTLFTLLATRAAGAKD